MNKQSEEIYSKLIEYGLSVYEDEVAEDEEEDLLNADNYNFFTLEYSDISSTANFKNLSQIIVVDYYAENRTDVWETVTDVITDIKQVKAITFERATKERLKMKDTERYVDRVSIIFKRMIILEC